MNVFVCESDDQILSCYPVMSELRPGFTESSFVARVRELMKGGYLLVGLEDEGRVPACAGVRLGKSLAWGDYCYVDDLVTQDDRRSRGYGRTLMRWIEAYGRDHGCAALHLDSGVQRHSAHRFYLRERMDIVFFHFKKVLG